MSEVVWHNDTHLIMQTAEADGFLAPENAYQIYERIAGTDDWNRQPDYKTSGSIVWYKTLEAAKEALPTPPKQEGE